MLLATLLAAHAGDLTPRPGLFHGDTVVVAVYDATASTSEALPGRIVDAFREGYPDATVLASSDFDELTPDALNVRLDVRSESRTPVSVEYEFSNRGIPTMSYGPAEADVVFRVFIEDRRSTRPREEVVTSLHCERAAANTWTESEDDVHARAWRACVRDLAALVDPFAATDAPAKPAAGSTLPEEPPASAARFTGLVYRAIDRAPPTDPAIVSADVRAVWARVRAGMDTGAIQAAAERGVAIAGKDASLEAILAAGTQTPPAP